MRRIPPPVRASRTRRPVHARSTISADAFIAAGGSRVRSAIRRSTHVELEPGWQGPILSGYGLHLVFLETRVDGRIPIWTEVRDRLVMDFNRTRSDRSKDALYEGLSEKYTIVIDNGDAG